MFGVMGYFNQFGRALNMLIRHEQVSVGVPTVRDQDGSLGHRVAPVGITNKYRELITRSSRWGLLDYALTIYRSSIVRHGVLATVLTTLGAVWRAKRNGAVLPGLTPGFAAMVSGLVGTAFGIWYNYWRSHSQSGVVDLAPEGALVPVEPFQPAPVWADEQRAAQMVPSELLGHLRIHAAFTARDVKVAQELKLKAKAWCDKTQMSELEKSAVIPRAVAAAMSPGEDEVAAHLYMGGRANKGIWAANAFTKSGALVGGNSVPHN